MMSPDVLRSITQVYWEVGVNSGAISIEYFEDPIFASPLPRVKFFSGNALETGTEVEKTTFSTPCSTRKFS